MKRYFGMNRFVAALTVALISLASAQPAAAGAPEPEGTITVIGRGEISAEPDRATVMVGVQLFDQSAQTAAAELRSRMEAVTAAIKEIGVPESQIQTTNYSIFFERDYQTPLGIRGEGGQPAGVYRVENMVRVTVPDVAMTALIVETALGAGANQMYGIELSFSDPAGLDARARELAVQNARRRAEELAASAGRSLGRVVEITEVIGGVDLYDSRAMAMGMGGGGGVMPGTSTYTARVQVTYELE